MGTGCENTESGLATANGGLIIPTNEFTEVDKVLGAVSGGTPKDAIVLYSDIRYAVGQARGRIIERIQVQTGVTGDRVVDALNDDPYYVQADDSRVQLLTATYNDVLGREARPVAIGDGAHVYFISRVLNFGPESHADHVPAVDGINLETPPFIAPGAGNAHGIDEWAPLKSLKTAFVLYMPGPVRLDQCLQQLASKTFDMIMTLRVLFDEPTIRIVQVRHAGADASGEHAGSYTDDRVKFHGQKNTW